MRSNPLNGIKKGRKRLVMITAYDAPTAELLESAGVDLLLVGDSVGNVLLGYPSTVWVSMDEMVHHARAVRRGAKKCPVIGDLPLKGVVNGPRQALVSARRFVREAGCDGVKVEWNCDALRTTRLLVANRIPVMGHVGLTPQTAARSGGYKVRGQRAEEALDILRQALAFERAGAFSVLLECVPAPVAARISRELQVPTIGIGAGRSCGGQVLVFHDLVGTFKKFSPRFVKRYADLEPQMRRAVRRFAADVRAGKFPSKRHEFGMPKEQLRDFKAK